jgi:hypothetical protein
MTSPTTLELSINSKPVPRVPPVNVRPAKKTLAPGARVGGVKRRSIKFVEHLTGDGPTVFRHVCSIGLEGIVSKRVDAPYRSGAVEDVGRSKNPESAAVRRGACGVIAVEQGRR